VRQQTVVSYPRVASLKTAAAFRDHLRQCGAGLAFDDTLDPPSASPLARPFELDGVRVGNRFCILPMEGWDGTADGRPSDLTRRRWQRFGLSGAKLIWGGEAVAVQFDGRANPNQLVISETTTPDLASLRETLVASHREAFGANADGDLYVGLQLTHSGRYAQPSVKGRSEPRVAYAHPLLDRRFPAGVTMMSDDDLDRLVDRFVAAAKEAWDAGYAFVDVKHCHGYLGHELLSARSREGKYGGSIENRTRFVREVTAGIRATVPGLGVAVRLSAFDMIPHRKSESGVGVPEDPGAPYTSAFGYLDRDDHLDAALADAKELLGIFDSLGIRWICITAGSPYYNPHMQRPALFPPSDGYQPPEDPLVGVARQIAGTAKLKAAFPQLAIVGSAYSYLQEWLPHVAQHNVRERMTDFVGLGRMVLSYPQLPADLLAGRPLQRKLVCRTFSDCTTGPRLGLVSGCYPLDPFYVAHPDAGKLKALKGN
jgi:2,4-dienoyl-CoA reductase-like NADH-dependent reductase (Old Yellow Enzyme family)